jgi:hypothetical protein
MKFLYEYLNERKQGTISKFMEFDIDIEATKHSIDRQNRKDDRGNEVYEPISFDEVNSAIEDATEDILDDLVKNKIDVDKDKIIIQREDDGLTVVGVMNNRNDKLVFVVITLYRGEEFRVGRSQKIYYV